MKKNELFQKIDMFDADATGESGHELAEFIIREAENNLPVLLEIAAENTGSFPKFFQKLKRLCDSLVKKSKNLHCEGFRDRASYVLHNTMKLMYYCHLNIRTFPYVERVNFEITSVCNLKCKFCSFKSGKRKHFIDVGFYEKTLTEIAENIPNLEKLALYMSGETLMHPQFEEILIITKKIKDRFPYFRPMTYLHTNGMLWTPEKNDKLMATGALTQVTWSIDGHNKDEFENMRPGAIYEKVLDNYEYFLENKPDGVKAVINNLVEPGQLGKQRCSRLEELFAKSDRVIMLEPKELNSEAPEKAVTSWLGECSSFCEYIFHTVVVTTEGQMSLCCIDYNSENAFGDIAADGFCNTYYGKEREELLKQFFHDRRASIKGCHNCKLISNDWSTEVVKSWIADYIRNSVDKFLNGKKKKIAVFGAGEHTLWLEKVITEKQRESICAVLDDKPDSRRSFFGLRTTMASDFNPADAECFIISSDYIYGKLALRCKELYGKDIVLLNVYEGLPPGPYPK